MSRQKETVAGAKRASVGSDARREELAEAKTGEQDADGRPLRADARRNYERLVTAARKVFDKQGFGAPMEAIAREAGVGVGTLYRHFPKRIDVVEAVYLTDVDELMISAEKAVANLDPFAAVEQYLWAFVGYARRKRVFLGELREAFDKNPGLKLRSRERIDEATQLVIGRAQRAGVVRSDVNGRDVMQLLGPVCTSPTLTAEQTERLLPLIIDGLRASARSE
jgi:AcrR family transcriptional regulator